MVADSGPLIALARLDLLRLPSQAFSVTWASATVWHEVTRAPHGLELDHLLAARQHGWLTVVADPPGAATDLPFPGLGLGERTALALALANRATVLMDERQGRAAAASAGLNVIGTLGLMVRGRRLGALPAVRPLTDKLVATGYHLARPLIELALAELGE